MISAEEAKDRSIESLLAENAKQLNKIASAIEKACLSGLRKIEIPSMDTNDFITRYLDEKGYALVYSGRGIIKILW